MKGLVWFLVGAASVCAIAVAAVTLFVKNGHGFSASEREWLSLATGVASVSLTLILWVFGYLVMGGSH